MRRLAVCAVAITVVTLLTLLPAILSPPMTHDSFWIDWVWADQFNAELRNGNLYPRWLPASHDGLGSPVFYYYPPLAFYVSGLFGLIGLSTYASIIAAFGVGMAASGAAMFAWLEDSPRRLAASLLFMVMPYHLFDFAARGAQAEFLAIAFIPLVALGLRRAASGKGTALAVAYAGLIMTHLPMALLVSLFLVLPWLLVRRLWSAVPPLAVGLTLSAIYLGPALLLEPFRDAGSLWSHPSMTPAGWSLFAWNAVGPDPNTRVLVVVVVATLLPIIAVLFAQRQRLAAGYALLVCAAALGLIPGMWRLPLLEQVQFPFRILPLAEFALVTALARARWRRSMLFALVPSLSVAGALLVSPAPPGIRPLAVLQQSHPDVPENLPPGERAYGWPSEWALAVARRAARAAVPGEPSATFYFPAWEVRCSGEVVATRPAPDTGLLAYRGSDCSKRLVLTFAEGIGLVLSLLGLVGMVLLWRRASLHGARAGRGGSTLPLSAANATDGV